MNKYVKMFREAVQKMTEEDHAINTKTAINKAINMMVDAMNFIKAEPNFDSRYPLAYAEEDNSNGYDISAVCIAIMYFYNRLSEKDKTLFDQLLNEKCGIFIRDIENVVIHRSDPEFFKIYSPKIDELKKELM